MESFISPFLHWQKRQRGPLGQSVSTNVVPDFCCTVVWAKFINTLFIIEGCMLGKKGPSALWFTIKLSMQISTCFFLYMKVKLILFRHQEWIFCPRDPSIFVHGIVSQRTGINYYHTCISLCEVNKVQLKVKIIFKPRIKLNHNF